MGIALLKLILHIRALPYRQLSLALFTVGENVVALSSPPQCYTLIKDCYVRLKLTTSTCAM